MWHNLLRSVLLSRTITEYIRSSWPYTRWDNVNEPCWSRNSERWGSKVLSAWACWHKQTSSGATVVAAVRSSYMWTNKPWHGTCAKWIQEVNFVLVTILITQFSCSITDISFWPQALMVLQKEHIADWIYQHNDDWGFSLLCLTAKSPLFHCNNWKSYSLLFITSS